MPARELVVKVWIDPGCVVCDTCQTACPEVFVVRDGVCLLRSQAVDVAFLESHSQAIQAAAAQCPVQAIRFAMAQIEDSDLGRDDFDALGPSGRVGRRGVLTAAGMGWLALAGSGAVVGLGLQRFMVPQVTEEPDPCVPAGELAGYAAMLPGSVNEDYKRQGFWVVRLGSGVVALSTSCPHLGCVLNWQDRPGLFKCPCHGSGFTQDGMNIEGPAPRPMERFGITVQAGRVVVDRSKRFRQEKGEWDQPGSVIPVGRFSEQAHTPPGTGDDGSAES